jgi:hypothetical protein
LLSPKLAHFSLRFEIFTWEGNKYMKKILVSVMMFLVFAIGLPLTAISADAQCRCRRYHHRTHYTRHYARTRYYATRGYTYERRPSFYRRHRNLINIGIATGAGALVGGLIGGRRGVGLGMLGGAGAGALYTYKLNPKRRRYYRYY